jgi:hypothetical protein
LRPAGIGLHRAGAPGSNVRGERLKLITREIIAVISGGRR